MHLNTLKTYGQRSFGKFHSRARQRVRHSESIFTRRPPEQFEVVEGPKRKRSPTPAQLSPFEIMHENGRAFDRIQARGNHDWGWLLDPACFKEGDGFVIMGASGRGIGQRIADHLIRFAGEHRGFRDHFRLLATGFNLSKDYGRWTGQYLEDLATQFGVREGQVHYVNERLILEGEGAEEYIDGLASKTGKYGYSSTAYSMVDCFCCASPYAGAT